jgi:hypothetical protein
VVAGGISPPFAARGIADMGWIPPDHVREHTSCQARTRAALYAQLTGNPR